MIDVIIFSKDRAAQLDLTLSGLKHYFREWREQSYTILYTYSSDLHKLAYDRAMILHPEFKWVKETNFQQDTKNIFNSGTKSFVSFLVDDDVWINEMSINTYEFNEFKINSQIACLSPRIAPQVNYCYTARLSTPPPKEFINKTTWNWTNSELAGDWNYPMSIASFHIFKKEDLLNSINNVSFRGPNSFEGSCLAPNPPRHRPLMICFENCKVFCGTVNRVQIENSNFHENSHNPDMLAKIFLMGKRFNPLANNGLIMPMCHGPVKLEYI